jgi:hypothetical protein
VDAKKPGCLGLDSPGLLHGKTNRLDFGFCLDLLDGRRGAVRKRVDLLLQEKRQMMREDDGVFQGRIVIIRL